MRVTPPVSIRSATSTADEVCNPAEWVGGGTPTTYAFGAIVKVAADYTIYESLAGVNTGNTPKSSPLWWRILGPTETAYDPTKTNYALGETCSGAHRCYESLVLQTAANPLPVWPEELTEFWSYVQPTNKWAMFDLDSNTQTVVASPLTVVYAPGQRINTIGVDGMEANSVTISATSVYAGGTVYGPIAIDLNTRIVNDHYDFVFEPFSTRPSLAVFNVPPYSDIVITVSIASTSGNVKCGSCLTGTYIYIGEVVEKASNDGLNFSTFIRDKWGRSKINKQRTVPKTSQILSLPSSRVNKAIAARILLNGEVVLWSGLDDSTSDWFDMFSVIGFYQKFLVRHVSPTIAEIDLDVEGP